MTVSSHPVFRTSMVLVPYDPTLPHISLKAHLEAVIDEVARRSLEVATFESKHLCLEGRLIYLAQHLPKMLTFPFSGVIALQAGNGSIVQACHCPSQAEFIVDQPLNVLSVGKLFTAIAVMQLIEEGKFSLKTPLSEILTGDELDVPLKTPYLEEKPGPSALKDLKKHATKITVEHLLSHTAGFVRRPGSENEEIPPGESWDPESIGEDCYSNYGYQLLARIIGKHTDCRNILMLDHEMAFRTHIEKRIFKPAGMEGAIREIHFPAKNNPGCFEISQHQEPLRVVAPEPYPHGNGCWRMTARDLLAFERAIHQPHVLIRKDSFQTIMAYKGRLGFWIDRDPRTGLIFGYGHPGGGPGMSSFLNIWCTDPSIAAVVLSNYSGCEMVKPWLDQAMGK